MDIQMPVMDGYSATIELRKNFSAEQLPIIAMTANVMAKDISQANQVGMNDHIGKPINLSEMFATMAKWFKPKAPDTQPDQNELQQNKQAAGKFNYQDLVNINVEDGLNRTENNHSLYQKLLSKFSQSYRDFEQKINEALNSEDPQAAEREAHSLKGIAANLGAEQLAQQALQLEQRCKEQQLSSTKDDICQQTLTALKQVIDSIEKAASSNAIVDTDNEQGFDRQQVKQLLNELDSLLADDDTAAADKLNEIYQLLANNKEHVLLNNLSQAIDDFDFDEARQQLASLTKQLQL
jgi:HPt (histidine-containing phosphotransfer) domain-containing protein